MNLFQIIVLSALAVVTTVDIVRLRWQRTYFCLLKITAWLAIAVAVANPALIQRFAQAIGIGRGADVVLYIFALTLVAACFCFYSRYLRLEEQITEVARTVAIDSARRGKQNKS